MSFHHYLSAAHVSVAAGGIGGSGRVGATLAAAVGLVSVVVGGLALARAGRVRHASALAASALGLTGAVLSVWHLALTTEGFGTGQGVRAFAPRARILLPRYLIPYAFAQ